MSIKVMIVDDHEVVRCGISALLASADMEVATEASSGAEALEKLSETPADVVMLDIRIPRGDGLDTLYQIKQRSQLPVLMFSAFDNPTYVARAVALGASGFLLKTTPKEELLEALRKVAAGQDAWTRDELRRVTGALATPRLNADIEVPLTHEKAKCCGNWLWG